jgi:hypothetical protein
VANNTQFTQGLPTLNREENGEFNCTSTKRQNSFYTLLVRVHSFSLLKKLLRNQLLTKPLQLVQMQAVKLQANPSWKRNKGRIETTAG